MKIRAINNPNPTTHQHIKGEIKSWYVDDKYIVIYSKTDMYIHIRIGHAACGDKHDIPYMDIQRIKDEFLGEDKVAIQIFPKKKDFISKDSPIYHIWHWEDMEVPNLAEIHEYNKELIGYE